MADEGRAAMGVRRGRRARRRAARLEAETACLRRLLAARADPTGFFEAEMLESIGDGFYALDRELRFTYAN